MWTEYTEALQFGHLNEFDRLLEVFPELRPRQGFSSLTVWDVNVCTGFWKLKRRGSGEKSGFLLKVFKNAQTH